MSIGTHLLCCASLRLSLGETGFPGGLYQEALVYPGSPFNIHLIVRKLGPFPMTFEVNALIYSTNIY